MFGNKIWKLKQTDDELLYHVCGRKGNQPVSVNCKTEPSLDEVTAAVHQKKSACTTFTVLDLITADTSYKRTVKQFRCLQITASVFSRYFFIKAYVVGTHLNCIDLSMQFK